MRWWKYLAALSIPLACAVSLMGTGWVTFSGVMYAFVVLPLIEMAMGTSGRNLDAAEKALAEADPGYDLLLYLMVPLQWAFVVFYLIQIQEPGISTITFVGRTTALGMMCGVIGINVGHELGHRTKAYEQFFAKALLLSSQYTHFFIEHNRGHHKHVATPEDPATARFNEPVYVFWVRSTINSYRSAWEIQRKDRGRKKYGLFSPKHEMLWYTFFQLAVISAIGLWAGVVPMLGYLGAATFGFLLLETVNYIEHYGLLRAKVNERRYANVEPVHSWNSNHVAGRVVLFELTRHSDHHHQPQKKYQVLDTIERAPQLPTGYPGMMVLSLLPPVWFAVMNPRVKALAPVGS